MDENAKTKPQPLLIGVRDACTLLDVSVPSLRKLVRAGELPAVRIDTRIRIARADIDAFIERRRDLAGVTP
ncbi:MAG TPA: helix-turn-helix domain-containing protein [Gaiellaceae bacterium]